VHRVRRTVTTDAEQRQRLLVAAECLLVTPLAPVGDAEVGQRMDLGM
jgi:hypothetical protein